MKRTIWLCLGALSMLGAVACDGDDDGENTSSSSSGGNNTSSSSSSSGNNTSSSSGSSGNNTSSSGGSSGTTDCVDTDFVYPADNSAPLAADVYNDYFTLDAAFPFDVVGFYTASELPTSVDEAGRLVAITVNSDNGDIVVTPFTVPAAAEGAITAAATVATLSPPNNPFGDGKAMYANYAPPAISLPNNGWISSYTSTAVDGIVPGYAFLFDGSTFKGGAWANGIYAGVHQSAEGAGRLLYHGFSKLSAAQSDENVSGVYSARDCAAGLVGEACGVATLLIPTDSESSGPLVKDAAKNIFVATVGADGVNVRGLSRCASLRDVGDETTPIATIAQFFTSSFAVVPPTATLSGFAVHEYNEYATLNQIFDAVPLRRQGAGFTAEATIANAIVNADDSDLTLLSDDKGYLWITIDAEGDLRVAKLRRRQN